MPTYLVGPTRPYTTITAAIAAIPTILTGTGVHEVIIDAGTYNEFVSIVKGGSSSSDYIIVRCADDSYHYGNINSGVIITTSNTSTATIGTTVDYCHIKNLVLKHTGDLGVNNPTTCLRYSSSNNQLFENLILISDGGGYGRGAFAGSGNIANPPHPVFYKCLAINLGPPRVTDSSLISISYGFGASTHNAPILINCASYNYYNAFRFISDPVVIPTVVNCWGYHNGLANADDFVGNYDSASSNNASRDLTAPGANSITNLTLAQAAFTSVSGNNFHISQHSSLYSVGSDQSALFTTDWDNETITTWSIGPDAQAVDNNCQSDGFNYTLSSISSPWSLLFGDASILTGTGLRLTMDDAVIRTPFSNSAGWVVTFPFEWLAGNTDPNSGSIFFGPSYDIGFTGTLPAIRKLSGTVDLTGVKYAEASTSFGAWNSTSIPGSWASSSLNITVTLFYKQTSKSLAARVTHSGINYDSGFVTIATGIDNEQLFRIISNNREMSNVVTIRAIVSSVTYRLDLTDEQVQQIYNGQFGVCSDFAFASTTSSSPWINQNTPHEEVNDAESPQLRTKSGDPSPSQSRSGRDTKDAKVPNLKTVGGQPSPTLQSSKSISGATAATKPAPKGYKDGFISIMPESGGYSASSLTLGTGNRPHFYSDNLGINKEFVNCGCVAPTRAFKSRVDVGQDPSGGFVGVLKSNDCIPLLQAHFQKRIGTTPATGTTYYEFSPNRGQLLMSGSSFGTGSYNSIGTWSAFTVSAYKAIEGSAYHFKTGVCDKLGFSFDARGEAVVLPNISFKDAEVLGTNSGLPTGSASTMEPFYGHQFSVDFLGLPVIKFDLESKNNLKKFRHVGTSGFNHQFGRYEVTGQATVDLAKVSLAHFGSMLGASSFAVVGTLYGDERNKMVFDMPNVVLKPYELNLNTNSVNVPFSCYESEDGGTAPLTIKLWTRNYSGTSFEPN